MFTRIAVVNRGEAAVRLIRAVRELNSESRSTEPLRVIALHTEAERKAMFVRQADEAVTLHKTGVQNPYLDYAELERALVEARADAVWVGWGFVAEDPTFADVCSRLGITFIGPSAASMRLLGDKVEAKILAEKVGVPVAPWSGGPVETRADARRHAAAIGYPLIIKARSGGGGRGIRKVFAEDELELALERTQGEAERSFGDPVVFLERLVTEARHVEVQVIADTHGNVWAPGVRDCSIQRRNQKVIEESSSAVLTKEQADELRTASAELVRAAGYHGAGTVEYLYQPEQKIFTFLEVNTRLQVEHPITEVTTGLDLVKLQILVAGGHALEGECPSEFGHAVEARLNAEDADNGFAPAPGTVRLLKFPLGSGLRVDTGIAQGDVIPPDYDSMVAKIIAWGRDRSEALARLRTALRETTVVIDGGTTTKSFLLDLLDREELIDATADTGWLDRTGAGTAEGPTRVSDVALVAAAVDAYDADEARERIKFLHSARGGRPRASHDIGRTVELNYQGQGYRITVGQVGPHRYLVSVDDREITIDVERLGTFERRADIDGTRYSVVTVPGPAGYLVEVDGISHQISQDEAGLVRAPAPAVVVAVPVAVGDVVEAGATLVVLEAMKMETAVRATTAGRVSEVLAIVNAQVDNGAALLRVDPIGEQAAASTTARVEFRSPCADAVRDDRVDALARLDELRALLSGYDVSASRALDTIAEYDALRGALPRGDGELVKAELDLLTTFADMCELTRNRPTMDEEDTDERVHSPREHFHSFLQSLDADVQGLPDEFRDKLARVLRHYDKNDLERGTDLEEAVYRLFLAQQRIENQVPAIAALLERWIADPSVAPDADGAVGEVLDRLVVATQVRYPVIGDVARNLRFQLFDEPQIRKAREQVYDGVRGSLQYLSENPDADDHQERIDALVATGEPLVELLSQRMSDPGALLEVITRQYYEIRNFEDVKAFDREGRHYVSGTFTLVGGKVNLLSTMTDRDGLSATLSALAETAGPAPENLAVDVYLAWPTAPENGDQVVEELRAEIAAHDVTTTWRRVTVTVFGKGTGISRQVTFRPQGGVLTEDMSLRDLHPLTGQRLDLWRLKNFDGTRIPSAPGTYLFDLVSKDNPKDERLVALAEIRDAAVQFDAQGNVVSVPAFERTISACLDGIRRAQARRGNRRLDHNRVVLYVWPVLDLPLDKLRTVARHLAPLTVAAGLEEITMLARVPVRPGAEPTPQALRFSYRPGTGVVTKITDPPTEPMRPLDTYTQNVQRSQARGTVYPYELIPVLTKRDGSFVEYDLDESGALQPISRPYGQNTAGIIVGLVSTPTTLYPEGITRVALFGDPTKALGTVAEAECARVVAAIDLAEEMNVPVEWFALSSGATISMGSGTENMDWVSRALRRIITFTQAGHEINVIVAGINVGAQPYWNAEATMLMHTKGILVMTPESAMVLTGKQSLDYSGGVSAEDNFGIGGYDRVMGPNGQAQYWAPNLGAACDVLFAHYDHAYRAPGERFPRRTTTVDPVDRDVRTYPHVHPSSDFKTVGDIFSSATNPERKKPFDIRTVMRAVVDQDHAVLERWADMADADTSVVFDAHLAGYPVSVIGIESRAIPRKGWFPADGPDQWTSGTLFPRSSKKTARAINAASGNRPLVVLANLSGFDGSPESLRNLQLEYGAEIGRAIVNFDGPIVFCVVSRYHGGAFVVFSGALNENMEVLAVEGSFASVLGGAPAAAVVFTRDVNKRTAADPSVRDLEARMNSSEDDTERARLQVELSATRTAVRSEKLGEVASEFEAVHNIERARTVGSVHHIVAAAELRPQIVAAIERGMARQ
ncbi:fused acetyl/propionyl-CoA carboxylase subuit alpha/methylmalonyl-CoA decarboxylase subunit alpha [Rhodococcus sp. Leaf7]|uniref:ATP-binding protein n=1 Tax=unclassified Rhodococcus (in: high G+C Gram-positive bacteria) TaxID=192944 RepID=UPI000701EF96|nr:MULTISPECIES: carboxyl transferase domain-containing protein [unclassified Rhodococcus (in: high G+C Gram-positive bacteria)]KQU07369.1 fused acetyl/propionyl-CoA carboxylase subuit alpha/methylmalonyl-CoA decarboxylase subunit alpha [Rhodococcus sp. Leaf7]KQU42889.1 fused acetyl/propionyl-CoA carboxylase subuit alpha/methylmalonyl-CoA decarboxylase subunit alpha [Rhodococcus sp. Leaf247]